MDKFKNICIFIIVCVVILLITIVPALYLTFDLQSPYMDESDKVDQQTGLYGGAWYKYNIGKEAPQVTQNLYNLSQSYNKLIDNKIRVMAKLYLISALSVSILNFAIGVILKNAKKSIKLYFKCNYYIRTFISYWLRYNILDNYKIWNKL